MWCTAVIGRTDQDTGLPQEPTISASLIEVRISRRGARRDQLIAH